MPREDEGEEAQFWFDFIVSKSPLVRKTKTVLESGFQAVDSSFQFSQVKISRIPESGIPPLEGSKPRGIPWFTDQQNVSQGIAGDGAAFG